MKIGNPQNMRGTPLLTSAVTSGGIVSGAGTSESPIVFNGIPALDSAGSSVMSGAKALKAGGGVSFSAGESGALVISANGGGGSADVLVNSVDSSVSDKAPVASAVYSFVDTNYARLSGGKVEASALPLATGESAGAVVIGSGLSNDGAVSVIVDSAIGNTARPVANSAVSAALAGKAELSVLSAHVASTAMHLPSGGVSGQHLVYGAEGAEWADQQTTGGAVTVETTLVDGANPVAGSAIVTALSSKVDSPELAGNAGKALVVNSGATGFELKEISSGATMAIDSEITSNGTYPVTGAAIYSALSGKIDTPAGGSIGQMLAKTSSGYEWADVTGGSIEYIDCSSVSETLWSGVTSDTALEDGKVIICKAPAKTASTLSITLTLSGGSGSSVTIPVYQRDSTQAISYLSGDRILLIYNETQNRWYDASPFHDTNDNALLYVKSCVVMGETVTDSRYVLGYNPNSSGYVKLKPEATYSPNMQLIYTDAGGKSSGAVLGYGYTAFAKETIGKGVIGTSISIPRGAPVYLKGTMGSDGLITLSSDVATTSLPSTEDGCVYQYLGIGADTAKFYFLPSTTVLEYRNGKVQPYSTASGGSVTVDSSITSDGANPVAGSAVYAAISGKMDIPESGVSGQVLTKTASGYEWASVQAESAGGTVARAVDDSDAGAIVSSGSDGDVFVYAGATTSNYSQGHIYKLSGGGGMTFTLVDMNDDEIIDMSCAITLTNYTTLVSLVAGESITNSTGGVWYHLDNEYYPWLGKYYDDVDGWMWGIFSSDMDQVVSGQSMDAYGPEYYAHSTEGATALPTNVNGWSHPGLGTYNSVLSGDSSLSASDITPSGSVAVDSSITSDGANPVAGSAIYTALSGKANLVHTHASSDISDISSFVSSAVSGKMDTPTGGTSGQVLTKTANGIAWDSIQASGMALTSPTTDNEADALLIQDNQFKFFEFTGTTTQKYTSNTIYFITPAHGNSGNNYPGEVTISFSSDENNFGETYIKVERYANQQLRNGRIGTGNCYINTSGTIAIVETQNASIFYWEIYGVGDIEQLISDPDYPIPSIGESINYDPDISQNLEWYLANDGPVTATFSNVIAASSVTYVATNFSDILISDILSGSSNGGSSPSSVSWDNVTSKPASFTPSSHTHTSSEITDLSTTIATAISGKMDVPVSGSEGQVLTKTASGVEWATVAGGGVVANGDNVMNVSTDSGMAALITSDNAGKSILFNGDTTSSYTQGHIYKVSGGNSLVMHGKYMDDNDEKVDWSEFSGTLEEYPAYTVQIQKSLLNSSFHVGSTTGGLWYRLNNGSGYYYFHRSKFIFDEEDDDGYEWHWCIVNADKAAGWNASTFDNSSGAVMFSNGSDNESITSISMFDSGNLSLPYSELYTSWTTSSGYIATDITAVSDSIESRVASLESALQDVASIRVVTSMPQDPVSGVLYLVVDSE